MTELHERQEALALFQAHQPWVSEMTDHLCRRLVKARPDDIHAACLWGLWQACLTWDGSKSPLRDWSRLRMTSAALDWLRQANQVARRPETRASRPKAHSLHEVVAVPSDQGELHLPIHEILGQDDRRRQRDAVQTAYLCGMVRHGLSWRDRLVLRLHYDEGFTLRETAAVFGLVESAAWWILRRILGEGREALRKAGYGV